MASKYKPHEKEILEMQKAGKTADEIARRLNADHPKLNATEGSIRGWQHRKIEKKEDQTAVIVDKIDPLEKTSKEPVNESTEKKATAKVLKPKKEASKSEIEDKIEAEVEARLLIKELAIVKKETQESFDFFTTTNKELTKLIKILTADAKKKEIRLFIGGGWILTMLFAMFAGYYIGRCYSRPAFHYILTLTGIPAGVCIGFGIAAIINKIKTRRK